MNIAIHPDAGAANAAAADLLATWLTAPDVRNVMLAAGNTPLELYRLIGERKLPLAHLNVFALDEYVGGLDDETLARALKHSQPAVRQNAVLLSEPRLGGSTKLREQLLPLAGDPDPHVRFQTALSLGEVRDSRVVPVLARIVSYECELKDGRTLSGLLASESSGNITLRMAQGVEEIVSRAQISKLTASRLSLMPQELEKAITPQELADLLAYLKGEQ